jgi:hypothetical protein
MRRTTTTLTRRGVTAPGIMVCITFRNLERFADLVLADVDEIDQACGVDAQCMNRSMQIECSEGDCKCGRRCQNQRYASIPPRVSPHIADGTASHRFQKRDYAPIDVVKTEKKGFGVRVREDLVA